MVKFKAGDLVRIISLDTTEKINSLNDNMLKIGDTFIINFVHSTSGTVDYDGYTYQMVDIELVDSENYKIYG